MDLLNRKNVSALPKRPIKVVQFGEGNFLRAFVDYAIQLLNLEKDFNAGVAVVQPIDRGLVSMLNDQDGLYTLFSKGVVSGQEIEEKHLIDSIVTAIDPYKDHQSYLALAQEASLEFIISNTTEAGIAFDAGDALDMQPPNSFPAKLTQLLYHRYQFFNGAMDKGLVVIPCELINYNADTLKEVMLKYIDLWNLDEGFKNWVLEANSFHNTLVDRIVPGYPKDDIDAYQEQLAYKDNLIVTSEVFFLWVIEGGEALKKKLPLAGTKLDVKIVADMQPYRTRKVRILNGAHTSMVPFSLLYGNETVKQTVDNDFTGRFVKATIFEEIIPTLDLPKEELEAFAEAVLDRFRNPFIKHQLASIALNSISKFKVRVLPSLLAYFEAKGKLPKNLTFAFACLLRFYKGSWKGEQLPVNDDAVLMDTFKQLWSNLSIEALVQEVLANTSFWDTDLTKIPGLKNEVIKALMLIEEHGVEQGYKAFV